jgi:hypothetical protein
VPRPLLPDRTAHGSQFVLTVLKSGASCAGGVQAARATSRICDVLMVHEGDFLANASIGVIAFFSRYN